MHIFLTGGNLGLRERYSNEGAKARAKPHLNFFHGDTAERGKGGEKKMKEKIEFIKPLMNFEVINLITSPFNFFKKY